MKNLGITRIEVLVVGLIIGILGVAAILSISSARSQTRDAVRLSDVRQVQVGLELFFNDSSVYPELSTALTLGEASTACLGSTGFSGSCSPASQTIYLDVVPAIPSAGLKGLSNCPIDVNNAYCYFSNGASYMIQYELENKNALLGLEKGLNCATEKGFLAGACSLPTN